MARYSCEVDYCASPTGKVSSRASRDVPRFLLTSHKVYHEKNVCNGQRYPEMVRALTLPHISESNLAAFPISPIPSRTREFSFELTRLGDVSIYELKENILATAPAPTATLQAPGVTKPTVKPVAPGDGLKIRMFINRNVGQVCDSWAQIVRISGELFSFCEEQRRKGPQFLEYTFSTLSAKLLSQAETQCALHRPSCFPLAVLVIMLSNSLPGFKDHFMHAANNTSPFIGASWTSAASKDVGGNLEQHCGIVYLYGAILQYSLKDKHMQLSSPFDISDAWRYVAAAANSRPKNFTSILLLSFLEVAHYSLFVAYGANFKKLLSTIRNGLVGKLPKESLASNQALSLFLDEVLHMSKLEPPKGMVISG